MSQKGFSLIEVVLVVSIISVIGCLALPDWQQLLVADQAYRVSLKLEKLLLYARSLAVIKQHDIEVCTSFDREQCSRGLAGNLIAFSGQRGGRHVYQRVTLTRNGKLLWRGFGQAAGVIFNRNGLVTRNGSFYYEVHGQLQTRLSVNRLGGVKLIKV